MTNSRSNVFDVAEYILEKIGATSPMKLQKLVYYSQAWSLVWDDDVLFHETIQAWTNGPVCRDLYTVHRGHYNLAPGFFKHKGNSEKLNVDQKDTIDRVLEFYGDKTSQWLSDLTHNETPWKSARKGLSDTERSESVITPCSMQEYYSSLSSG